LGEIEKVLITGSNGMLGKDIVQIFRLADSYDIYGINRNHDSNLSDGKSIVCDITNLKELQMTIEEIKPNIIIHCAAIVDVDGCEKKKEYANKINVESTKQLVAFRPESTKFVYISTDSVFDGQDGGYIEESVKNPINYYSTTKSIAEEVVKSINKNSIIIRTNIYGFHKNKGKSLVEWALGELLERRKISGFNDVCFNPVYTHQLAKIVFDLVKINYSGIIHVGTNKPISKYEFLRRLALKFGVDPELVNSISVDYISFNAKRPKNTFLSTRKLHKLLNYEINVDDGLFELLRDYSERSIKNEKD
jgi:dTDP-4-dehydrorhamnose reductase